MKKFKFIIQVNFDVSDARSITMTYQYIETLSDEAVKRYQSADFCFPLCRN